MQTDGIASFESGTDRDSFANKALPADQMLTTPIMLKHGTTEEGDGRFVYWVATGMEKFTYFAVGLWTGRIKIGSSNDPWRRASELIRSNNGEEAKLVAVLRGRHLEGVYHREFREYLDGCEWYLPHPDILAEIERLKVRLP